MTTNPRTILMRKAVRLAIRGIQTNQGGPFGALIVKNGDVVGRGFNRVVATNDPTAHAEIVAIRQATRRLGTFKLDGCELYTSCEPCPMCLAAAYWARITRVVYGCERGDAARAGFDDAFLYEEFERAPADRRLFLEQHGRDDALRAFQAWMEKPDRTMY